MRRVIKLKRYWIWLLALAGLAVGLCFTPLLNLLGFEFSLVMALAGSLAGLHLGSVQVAAARGGLDGLLVRTGGGPAAFLGLYLRAAAVNLSLLLPPLIIISLNALRVKNCDYLEGLAFYAVLPGVSLLLATAAGVVWGALIPRPWLATLASLLTLVASALWGFWRFYDAPAIFAFDPFVGYFPGAMYDETVSISSTLLLYRLHNLAWAAGALLLAAALVDPVELRVGLRRRRLWPLLAAAPCLLLGLGMFVARAEIGFAISAADVARELGGVTRTKHFTIHYPAEMEQERVKLLERDHEFRHAQLAKYLGVSPPAIRSFIFADSGQKRRLMGAGRTFVAKPWRGEVYLQDLGFPHRVLKHELAHVFGALFGDPIFGISLSWQPLPRFNVGLIEGLAVAADWRPYGESTAHQYAAALRELKLAPPLESLFGTGFLAHAAGRSYTLAGSFCRRLIDQHGVEKFRRLFASGGDFASVYGRPLPGLLRTWEDWLDSSVQVPDATLQLARERFRRPGILHRVCGHEVANLRAEAAALQRKNDDAGAIKTIQRVCAFEPGEPGHRLNLVNAQVRARRLDDAAAEARSLLDHPGMSKPLRREVLQLMGDMRWWAGDAAGARARYQEASKLAASPGGRRVLTLKLWGLEQEGEAARLVQRYIAPAPSDPRDPGRDVYLARRLQDLLPAGEDGSTSGIGLYLVGKQLAGRAHCDLAVAPLRRALALGLPDADFVTEAELSLVRCQHRLGKLPAAARTIGRLVAAPLPGGVALRVQDWQSRVRWESHYTLQTR